MACFRPLMAKKVPDLKTRYGKDVIRFLKFEEGSVQDNWDKIKSGEILMIPCGKCIGCRLDHGRHWADRMILELDKWKKSVFVTLTYADEFLPEFEIFNSMGSPAAPLIKREPSDFMKRLRSDLDYHMDEYSEGNSDLINWTEEDGSAKIKVRFYACGEYGEKFGRPHYHIILFGLSLDDLAYLQQSPLKEVKRNELGQITYESYHLERFWNKGFVNVSESNYFTMGYVARYTMKKAQGSAYPKEYGLPDEFVVMSRSPGIGGYFLVDHPDLIDKVSYWSVAGKNIYWPTYLVRKQHEVWSDEYQTFVLDDEGEKIKKARSDLALNKFVQTFELDEKPYYEKQEFLERQKEFSAKKLRRGDVTLC